MRHASEAMTDGHYLPVTELSSEVAEALQAERDAAWQVIEERRALAAEGKTAEIPLTIDALSTADSVIEARDTFGIKSPEFQEKRSALFLDCLRLVKEWNRKLKPEHFGQLRHHFSQPEEEFYSHGLAVGQMTHNALRPIDDSPEDEARRVNEKVEDRTPIIIQKIGGFALNGIRIRTISECTDKAKEDFEKDQAEGNEHAGYDGMVPEVEKLMVRDITIDPMTGDRIQEQVGLIGKHSITHYVVQETLRRNGIDASDLDKTGVHGLQFLATDSLKDFTKQLDQVASEEWCVPMFMGERVDTGHSMDYDAFWHEAEQREEDLSDMAEVAASFILDLADDGFDRRKAPAHIENFVKKLLLKEAKKDIQVAHHAFGEETAKGLLDVQRLEQQGRLQEAFDRMQEVEKAAPGGGYCGAGSCGLEGVNRNSEEGKTLAEKLKAKAGDEIVKDKERACKCGAKSIVYAYSKDKVNKYCESCHSFESKVTK